MVKLMLDDLNSFLAVAKDLEVKGLTENNTCSSKPKRPNAGFEDLPPQVDNPSPRPALQTSNEDEEIQELLPEVKLELA